MFNIGPQELVLILVLALLVVGPQRLPEIARSIGKGMRELRKAQDEVRKTIQVNLDEPSTAKTRSPRRLPETDAAATSDGPAPTEATASETGADDLTPTVAATTVASAVTAEPETTGVGEISRTLGRTLAELRRAREEVQRSFRIDADPPISRTGVADRSGSGASAPAETAAPPLSDETRAGPDVDAPSPRPAPAEGPAPTDATAPDGDAPSVAAGTSGDGLERPA